MEVKEKKSKWKIIIILLFLDQLIKYLIVKNMYLGEEVTIIKNFLNITYVTNNGAAFNILSGNTFFLIILAIIVIIYILKNIKKIEHQEKIIYEILIAGILGNLIDRIFRGNVIDYIAFKIFGIEMAIFNLADTYIVCSCILLLIMEALKWKKSQLKNQEKD